MKAAVEDVAVAHRKVSERVLIRPGHVGILDASILGLIDFDNLLKLRRVQPGDRQPVEQNVIAEVAVQHIVRERARPESLPCRRR